jgi:hypothetical protein
VNVVDLHPENLLDREIRGELDGAERQRLQAHLALCPTCRLERQLRADFALELSRDSTPPGIASLVDSLARRSTEPPAPVAVPLRKRRVRIVLLTAAATLTVVAGALASTEAGRRAVGPWLGREAAVTPNRERPSWAIHAPMRVPSAAVGLDASPGEVEAHAVVEHAPAPRAVAGAASADSPGRLFGAEAEARRRGDAARLLELHAQLIARYPQTREAQVSRMMVARMLLDRGDAAGALSGFDAYLRAGSGDLREDALAGRATALDRLGRTEEGRRGWMALLDQFPNTAYGAHARARVEASGEN